MTDREPPAAQVPPESAGYTAAASGAPSSDTVAELQRERDALLLRLEAAERRAERVRRLHEAAAELARSLEEDTVLQALARVVDEVLAPSAVAVCTTDAVGRRTQSRVYRCGGATAAAAEAPARLRALAERAITARETVHDGSAAAVPAVLAGTVLGALVVEGQGSAPLPPEDVELLRTIAAQAAAALGNARRYAESQRQQRQTEALADVTRAVGESLQLDRVLHLILRHVAALLPTDGATISLLRGGALEIVAAIGTGEAIRGIRLPLVGSISGRVARTGTSMIGDVSADPDAYPPSVNAAGIQNAVIVPLTSAQGAVGVLSAFNRASSFTRADADVLHCLADQVAVAVVNARLFEEVDEGRREWAVAFDAVATGMVVLDDAGRIRRTNAAARRIIGASDDALQGADLYAALFSDGGPVDSPVHRVAIRSGAVTRRTHADRQRGRVFDLTAAPHPLGGAVVTFDDVTDHRALAERHRRVVDTSSDAIVITDLERRIAYANPAAIALFGHGDALLGMPVSRIIPDDVRELVRRHEDLALGGEPQRYEGAVVRADGERRIVAIATAPLRELGEVTGIVASLRDVTGDRARADALARSEARYARLVESASDAIFTVDHAGRFTAVNRSLEQGVGRPREMLLGTRFAEIVDPLDAAAVERLLRDTFAGERRRGSLRYRDAAGEARQGSLITSPIFEGKTIVGALGILRDVTDEQRVASQLLQQEKLAAVGQLVSGVAHELNNPLASVTAFAELLLASPATADPEARQAVESIHDEAMRAAKVVSHLLTFARQQPAERVDADVNAIVADTLALREYALRTAQVQLQVALDRALPHTWADPFQLQQVVLNLLTNAEQALTGWDGPRRMAVETRRDGDWLVIAVSDTGPGLAPEQRDRIFNPFYTTKPVGEGAGLGLSISDGIVREHGGQIRVESRPGEGAAFLVELPIVEPPAPYAAAPPARTVAAGGGGGGRRVLVVDDEPTLRKALARFLGTLGYVPTVAAGGDEARALLLANEYDVILLDLRMPDVGGDTLYRELHDRDPRQARRVVFVTGDVQSEHARRLLEETGRPSVSKPFQLDDLAAVLAGVTA